MGLKVITPAADMPVTLEDVKAHMRFDCDDEDALITAYLAAAVDYAQGFTNRQFMPATLQQTLPCFPLNGWPIELARAPLKSIESVKYLDSAGDLQTMDADDYYADDAGVLPRVFARSSWPSAGGYIASSDMPISQRPPAVFVEFMAGDADAVPATILTALRILTSHWFENREPVVTGTSVSSIPLSVESLLWMERIVRVA